MKLQNKLIVILVLIFTILSFSSTVFGKYIIEIENKEITNINIKKRLILTLFEWNIILN